MAEVATHIAALSEEAMKTGLAPMRLPDMAAGGVWAELVWCALFGLCLGLVLERALSRSGPSLLERLENLTGLKGEERRLGLLYLLREFRPKVLRGWGDRLYRRGNQPDAREIEERLRNGR